MSIWCLCLDSCKAQAPADVACAGLAVSLLKSSLGHAQGIITALACTKTKVSRSWLYSSSRISNCMWNLTVSPWHLIAAYNILSGRLAMSEAKWPGQQHSDIRSTTQVLQNVLVQQPPAAIAADHEPWSRAPRAGGILGWPSHAWCFFGSSFGSSPLHHPIHDVI